MDEQTRADIAHAFQEAVVATMVIKCRRAFKETGMKTLVIAGGVSANTRLRQELAIMAEAERGQLYYPQLKYCTDNGAMIAYAGCQRLMAGQRDDLGFYALPRWNLESLPAL
jgi:N6-L-threonylcarbamoyladenine synthase